jgi:hypothetical protein
LEALENRQFIAMSTLTMENSAVVELHSKHLVLRRRHGPSASSASLWFPSAVLRRVGGRFNALEAPRSSSTMLMMLTTLDDERLHQTLPHHPQKMPGDRR